jgi:hypothetical protein
MQGELFYLENVGGTLSMKLYRNMVLAKDISLLPTLPGFIEALYEWKVPLNKKNSHLI